MRNSENNAIFQIRKTIKDVKNYNRDWYYTDTFNRFVEVINNYGKQLELPMFQFENFHFSSTRKTINDTGYKSLMNHIETLEEMLPKIQKNNENSFNGNENIDKKKVFVVHGRNRQALLETEGILSRAGLEPIVLSRMVNSGFTLIEKFEKYSDVQYAVVLLTPDDVGAFYEKDVNPNLHFRARQNVLFELGFFYGKLGRSNVCCLLKQSVEKPTDIDGIAYVPFVNSVEEVELSLLKELREAKLTVNL